MREQAQGLDRRNARVVLTQGFAQDLADLGVAVEEHVLLTRKVIEHRHAPDVGGGRDFVHRHLVEAPRQEELRGGVGDALPRGQALAGSEIGWR